MGGTLLVITLFCLNLFLGLLVYSNSHFWRRKKIISVFNIICLLFSAIAVFAWWSFNILSLIYILTVFYAIFNYFRLIKARLNDFYLYNSTSQTFVFFVFIQTIALGTQAIFEFLNVELSLTTLTMTLIFGAYLVVSVGTAMLATYNLIRSKANAPRQMSDNELPTVTVAIAARNEDEELNSCLASVLKDTYPKLEIIVYDDQSYDHTAEIIRQFAHDGVRFIKGVDIPDDWLAKNYAYQKLLQQASGEIVMFIGTDVRLHKDSIRGAVQLMLSKNITMACVMPERTRGGVVASLIQPMRYWWELAVPRLKPNRPPTLSTSWLIKKSALLKIGGFSSYKRSILPENHLSKLFNKTSQYKFVRSSRHLNVTTHKNFTEQWQTVVRVRYPEVHRRPEYIFIRTFFLLALVLPLLIFLPLILSGAPKLIILAVLTINCMLLYSHFIVSYFTNKISGWLAPFNFPFILMIDILANNISMYKYEFSEVLWKERNVAQKSLSVYKRLPKLNQFKLGITILKVEPWSNSDSKDISA